MSALTLNELIEELRLHQSTLGIFKTKIERVELVNYNDGYGNRIEIIPVSETADCEFEEVF